MRGMYTKRGCPNQTIVHILIHLGVTGSITPFAYQILGWDCVLSFVSVFHLRPHETHAELWASQLSRQDLNIIE